jgi:MFS family permease
MLVSYRAVLARPGARPLAVACALGWLSFAAYGLAVVLAVRGASGSFASAGGAVAGFSAASALLAPARGRWVDRRGPRAVAPFAAAHLTAMALLVAGCALAWPAAALIGLAAAAGACVPPFIATARSLWPGVAGEELTRTGHALNAALGDAGQVAGPALVGAAAALASPSLALALLIPGVALGTVLLLHTARHVDRDIPRQRTRVRGVPQALRPILGVELLLGLALGALDVAAPVVADAPALAGLPLIAFAAGSIAASVWSGAGAARHPPRVRYARGCALFALAAAPTPLLTALPAVAALLVLGGAGYGLLNVAVFELLEEVVPPGRAVEAFTWLTTAAGLGLAAGAALAGQLATHGPAGPLAALAVAAALAAAFAARRGTMSPMSRRDELEALSSKELHDRAVARATKHLDVKFLWNLMQMVPAAEAAAGEPDQADYDVAHWSGQVADTFRDDDGRLSDALRPVYLDYLEQHADG